MKNQNLGIALVAFLLLFSGTAYAQDSNAPRDLVATPNADQTEVRLTWQQSLAAESGTTVSGYQIERFSSRNRFAGFVVIRGSAGPGADVPNYIDSSPEPSRTYRYRVRARISDEASGATAHGVSSNEVTVVIRPAPPEDFVWTRVSTTRYELQWGPFQEADSHTIAVGTGQDGDTVCTNPIAVTDSNNFHLREAYFDTVTNADIFAFDRNVCVSVTAVNSGGSNTSLSFNTPRESDRIFSILEGVIKAGITSRVGPALAAQILQLRGYTKLPGPPPVQPVINLNGIDINLDAPSASSDSASGWLMKHAEDLLNGNLDSKDILANSKFALPFHTVDSSPLVSVFWGRGDYRILSNETDELKWDGGLFGFATGIDVQMSHTVTGGLSISNQAGKLDYTVAADSSKGEYDLNITSIQPYLSWNFDDTSSWVALISGGGTAKITDDSSKQTNNIKMQGLAAGHNSDIWRNSSTIVKGLGYISLSRVKIDSDSDIADTINADSQSVQVSVEASRITEGDIIPSLEWGARYTDDENQSLVSMIFDGKIRHANRISGVTFEGRLYTLIGANDYNEGGVSGFFNIAPGKDQQGFSLNLEPKITTGASTDMGEWKQLTDQPQSDPINTRPEAALDISIGYGMSVPNMRGKVIPYGESHLSDSRNRKRIGTKWNTHTQGGYGVQLDLFTERKTISNATDTSVVLKGALKF